MGQSVVGIHPDGSSSEAVAHIDGFAHVLGEYCGRKPIIVPIGSLDRLFHVCHFLNRLNWTKDFLPAYLHVILDISEDSGLDEEALVTMSGTPCQQFGTFLLSRLHISKNLFHLLLINLGPLLVVHVKGISNGSVLSSLNTSLHKFIIDLGLNHDPAASTAALPHVAILENDVGRLATQLKSHPLQVISCTTLDDLSDLSGTCEGHLVDVRVCGNGSSSSWAKSCYDIDNSLGEASLLDQSGNMKTSEWGL